MAVPTAASIPASVLSEGVGDPQHSAACEQLLSALCNYGYALVQLDQAELLADGVQKCRCFFDQTDEAKHQYKPCGFANGVYKQLDGKELFEYRIANNQSTIEGGPISGLDKVFWELDGLARLVAATLGSSCNLHSVQLLSHLDRVPLQQNTQTSSLLHVSRYSKAGCEGTGFAGVTTHSCREHHDRGLLTLVYSKDAKGLQVQQPETGLWQDVPLAGDVVAVMPGYTLEFLLAGRIKAASHRVVPAEPGRLSIVHKLRCRPDARLDVAQVLQLVGSRNSLDPMYHDVLTTEQLMARFDASHPGGSVNERAPPAASASEATTEDGQADGMFSTSHRMLQPQAQQQQEERSRRWQLQGQAADLKEEPLPQQQKRQRMDSVAPQGQQAASVSPAAAGTGNPSFPAVVHGAVMSQAASSRQSSTGQAPGQQQGQGQGQVLNICLKDLCGTSVHFKVHDNVRLNVVFRRYCSVKYVDIHSAVFIFGGHRLMDGNHTCRDMGMQDGDVIDVVMKLLGD